MKENMAFIFDFDGTLVDSFPAAIELFNTLADEYRFKKIEEQDKAYFRNFTSKELIRYLNIPLYKLPRVLLWARKQMHGKMLGLSPFPGLHELLYELSRRQVPLGIVTSNSSENVTLWLKRHQIYDLFDFIHVESSYFGKKRILKKILKTQGLDPLKTFYIGDETRDVEAAKACKLFSVAVTWGFNSEMVLAQYEPDFLIRKPEEILGLIKMFPTPLCPRLREA